MRKPLVAGNWKMHGDAGFIEAYAGALRRAGRAKDVDFLLFPPACYLDRLVAAVADTGVEVGAQNAHWASDGAFTGEIAPGMVRELGAGWVLAGHSERRALFGDTDERVADKVVAALEANLQPILCVGESLAEREAGSAEAVVARQFGVVAERIGREGLARLSVAYEPVWAIGTGRTASPAQAQAMHAYLRSLIEVRSGSVARDLRILYGGSVTPENAPALFAEPDIDGVLVGGASLVVERLLAIVRAAEAVGAHRN